jgi:hypothetical protein
VHTVSRIRTRGFEQIPETGAALIELVGDEPARRADVLMVMATSTRPLRILLDKQIDSRPVFGALMRAANAIFVDSGDSSGLAAFESSRDALRNGQQILITNRLVDSTALVEGLGVPAFELSIRRSPKRNLVWQLLHPTILLVTARNAA